MNLQREIIGRFSVLKVSSGSQLTNNPELGRLSCHGRKHSQTIFTIQILSKILPEGHLHD